ncbi:AraC family transcriptional regulator [Sphingomonas sp. R1]|uniref:AraC family transcriptional regulator n=1 Tax=Sphingomonas sp. R1 TaxID=399176 RepID=UPI002225AEEA|nr:AraC family transcriptional regulator [Sphingomonas sp. R1]UYY76848.1 AraC family transcriptional regulator [Sphingomonas sp. R1]
MRGQDRNKDGRESSQPNSPGLIRFSTNDLPERDRVALWRDQMGQTLTGCNPSSLDGGTLSVDFAAVGGAGLRLATVDLTDTRNNRDAFCLSDGDEDLILFLSLSGEGWTDHYGERVRLQAGDGMLARFDRTLDTGWPRSRLLLVRLSRAMLGGVQPDAVLGQRHRGDTTVMRLLGSYARTAWEEAARTGFLHPLAERHMAELVSSLCAAGPDEQDRLARPALGAARVAAMLEVMALRYSNPCLCMRDVAAAVGVSERAGHLAFEDAELSFTQELYGIRLSRAAERLSYRYERVMDTAFSVGFSDMSHFHRLFKRRYACTPREWQERSHFHPGVDGTVAAEPV